MCYKICSHSTVCDVRTVVVGETPDEAYVDPYTEPRSCSCEKPDAGIRAWFRCFYHKCCRVSVTWKRCDKVTGNDICPDPKLYHKYEQAGGMKGLPQSRTDISAVTRNRWHSIPVLDADIGLVYESEGELALSSELFVACRTMMLIFGRLNFESILESLCAEQEIQDLQPLTCCEHHDICERVLLKWECPASRAEGRIQEIYERLHQLEQARAGYRAEFSRWKSQVLRMMSSGEGHCAGLRVHNAGGHQKTTQTRSSKRKPLLTITIPKQINDFIQVEVIANYIPSC